MNIVGNFKTLEKVPTESNLSDTTVNVFNIDLSGVQINNIPDSIIENDFKISVSYHRGRRVKILQ
jgi:hypothetical protein